MPFEIESVDGVLLAFERGSCRSRHRADTGSDFERRPCAVVGFSVVLIVELYPPLVIDTSGQRASAIHTGNGVGRFFGLTRRKCLVKQKRIDRTDFTHLDAVLGHDVAIATIVVREVGGDGRRLSRNSS